MVLLVLNAIVGVVVIAQTITEVVAGDLLTPAVVAAFVVPFILLAFFAVWFAGGLLKNIKDGV